MLNSGAVTTVPENIRAPMTNSQKFADLGRPRRVWAVGAIHGDVERLTVLHDAIGGRFSPGDRLVYLGNFLGHGPHVGATVDEMLAFRRALLSVRGVQVGDIIYLRGSQEEMWQKLLQLQFAPNPREVLDWMLRQGVEATLLAYGGNPTQGMAAARDGAVSVTRWTNGLRAAIRSCPGHENLMSALRRAAYTSAADGGQGQLLLVSSGIDVTRPLAAQGDAFWWGGAAFGRIDGAYGSFGRVIRGYDPGHGGVRFTDHTASLDGGCGFGGRLACAGFAPTGEILEILEV